MGISVSQLLSGTIPEPTHTLEWGKDIPKDVLKALDDGETATLLGEDREPYSIILKDQFGTIREQRINSANPFV